MSGDEEVVWADGCPRLLQMGPKGGVVMGDWVFQRQDLKRE